MRDYWTYTYDTASNRLTRDLDPAQVSGAPTDHDQVFTYDGLHRLATFKQGTLSGAFLTNKNFEEQWTLDQLGNWPYFKQDDDGNGTWDLDQFRTHILANEIGVIGATSGPNWADVEHDDAGNMITMPQPKAPTSSYAAKYDAWNRLIQIDDGMTVVQTSEYDGRHHRIQKTVGSDTFDYYYNERWQVLEERKNGDSDPLAQYVWHPYYVDALAVRYYDENVDGSGIVRHWYLQDANFNVTAVVDDSGAAVERYAYTPYGEVTILDANFAVDSDQVSDIGNHYLYTGRERDPETGLYNFRTRYYHVKLGRFTSRDWIAYQGGLNLYGYVGGRPTYYLDPMGLKRTRIDVARKFEPCTIYIFAGHYLWVDNQVGELLDDVDDFLEDPTGHPEPPPGWANPPYGDRRTWYEYLECFRLGGVACFSTEIDDDIHWGYQIPGFPDRKGELDYADAVDELIDGVGAALGEIGEIGKGNRDTGHEGCPCKKIRLKIICQPEFAWVIGQPGNDKIVPGLNVPASSLCGKEAVLEKDSRGGNRGRWSYCGEFECPLGISK